MVIQKLRWRENGEFKYTFNMHVNNESSVVFTLKYVTKLIPLVYQHCTNFQKEPYNSLRSLLETMTCKVKDGDWYISASYVLCLCFPNLP
jgi:hypothetical protein